MERSLSYRFGKGACHIGVERGVLHRSGNGCVWNRRVLIGHGQMGIPRQGTILSLMFGVLSILV